MKLGRYCICPMRLGGGPNVYEIEHRALLEQVAVYGFDISEDTAVFAETYAHALALCIIWRINGRLANGLIPARMLETLPVWEEACGLRPRPGDTDAARRRAVASKFLGFIGNTVSRLYDVCAAMGGANFVGFNFVQSGDASTYWAGLNPGPPGFEFCSNRAALAAILTPTGLSTEDFRALLQNIYLRLVSLAPAWMGFYVGTGEGFIAGVGIAGLTCCGAPP